MLAAGFVLAVEMDWPLSQSIGGVGFAGLLASHLVYGIVRGGESRVPLSPPGSRPVDNHHQQIIHVHHAIAIEIGRAVQTWSPDPDHSQQIVDVDDAVAGRIPGVVVYSTTRTGRNSGVGFSRVSNRFDVLKAASSPRSIQPKFVLGLFTHCCTLPIISAEVHVWNPNVLTESVALGVAIKSPPGELQRLVS